MTMLVMMMVPRASQHQECARLVHPKGCLDFPSVVSGVGFGFLPALTLLHVPLGWGILSQLKVGR